MTANTETQPHHTPKKLGRPKKADPPRIAYHELDRLLVFGDIVDGEDGRGPAIHYPSYRDLAKRYAVSHSVIAGYAQKHDCLRRREAAKDRVNARTDDKLVELRATELVTGKVRALDAIDAFLRAFGQALAEGRVRVDSVTDFNVMIRLKEFLEGGPDSRHEVHASLSLDELQRRHREMLRRTAEGGGLPELTGRNEVDAGDQDVPENPPARAFEMPPRKANGQFGSEAEGTDNDGLAGVDDDDDDTAASD